MGIILFLALSKSLNVLVQVEKWELSQIQWRLVLTHGPSDEIQQRLRLSKLEMGPGTLVQDVTSGQITV